jgi:hypothetical protein
MHTKYYFNEANYKKLILLLNWSASLQPYEELYISKKQGINRSINLFFRKFSLYIGVF